MSSEADDKPTFQDVQERLERLCGEIDALEQQTRDLVYETLDAVDVLHRTALAHLAETLGEDGIRQLRDEAHPAVAWLLAAYDVDPDVSSAGEDGAGGETEAPGQGQAADQPEAGVEPPPGATILTVQER